jgi:serine/threonine protein kinase
MQIWLNIFILFFLYANKSTKSRANKRNGRLKAQTGQPIGPSTVGCPEIPRCQWARFEELQLKVQQGAQSAVSMLVDNFNKKPVIKKIFSDKRDFINEMSALSCIRIGHNPLLVYPLCVDPMNMILVLEYGGDGDLTRWDLFRDNLVKYSYEDVVKVSAQIVASVAAAHRRGYLHGDIKPENFVIDLKQKSIKLIDFGLSARLGENRIMTQGTPQTMAPEVAFLDFFTNRLYLGPNNLGNEQVIKHFREKPQFIKESMDWWSVGVTIHYIFAKFFEDENRRARLEYEEYNGKRSLSNPDSGIDGNSPSSSSSGFKIEISESDDHYFPYKIIWAKDGRDILHFEYRDTPKSFQPSLVDFLSKLMAWNPEKRNFNRNRIQSLLQHEFFEKIDWNEIDPSIK